MALLKQKLHMRKFKGTHFIRTTLADLQTESRVYVDASGQPLTEETASTAYTAHKAAHPRGAVQVFDRSIRLVESYVPRGVLVCHESYVSLLKDIDRAGVGFTFSPDNTQTLTALYIGVPFEMLHGLPFRQVCDITTIDGIDDQPLSVWSNEKLVNEMNVSRAQGLSVNDALAKTLKSISL